MNGIISILKPSGMTSHDVVSFVRKCTGIRKVGHTGTLDPNAAGVLPICIGKATKVADMLTSQQKRYRAEMTLGITTDTQDSDGKILKVLPVDIDQQRLIEVISSFKGDIEQVPPMYSAIKVKGKKLYELARQGIEIKRQPRKIKIYDIRIINIDFLENTVLFDVICSKGTYIRTLCVDIGEKLGCGAHMSFLLRTGSGLFDINQSVTLEQFKDCVDNKARENLLSPIDSIFLEYEKITIDSNLANKVRNGNPINIDFIESLSSKDEGIKYRIYDNEGNFLCVSEIVKIHDSGYYLKMLKSFFEVE